MLHGSRGACFTFSRKESPWYPGKNTRAAAKEENVGGRSKVSGVMYYFSLRFSKAAGWVFLCTSLSCLMDTRV
jgi:hypothetical protein